MVKKLCLLSSMLLLTACDTEPDDLREWVNTTKKEAEGKFAPADIPKGTPQLTYTPPVQPALDVFNSKRLNVNRNGVNAPDLNRPKEVLEAFELDNIKYVGSFSHKGQTSAFVEVDGHVYTVRKGNYIGKNYGRITNIRADAIDIMELVEDAYGNWTFHQAELILNNSNQTKN